MDTSGFFSSFSGKALAIIIAVLVITGLAVPDTYLTLHTLWSKNNETYSHGYILLMFVIYVLVTDFRWQKFSPSFWPVPLALGAGLVWLAANAVQVMLLQTLVLPGVLWCALAAMVGIKNSLKTLVPILSLYLALPIMDVLIVPLQNLTTWVNTKLIHAVGITAFIDGYDIHMPYGVMRIAHGCAGLNYLLAGVCLGVFYAYLNLQKLSLQLRAVALIVLLSLVGNWIRVFLLILIGYESKMQSELVYEHGFFGWVIFAILAVFFFFYAKRLEKKDGDFTGSGDKPELKINGKMIGALVATMVAFAALPVWWSQNTSQTNQDTVEVNLPSSLEALSAAKNDLTRIGAKYEGHDFSKVFTGRDTDYRLTLAVASYFKQAQGKELIYYANQPAAGITGKVKITVDGKPVNAALTRRGQVVFWVYRIGDEVVTSELDGKLAQLKQIFRSPVASALILQVDCRGKCGDPEEVAGALTPQIKALYNTKVR